METETRQPSANTQSGLFSYGPHRCRFGLLSLSRHQRPEDGVCSWGSDSGEGWTCVGCVWAIVANFLSFTDLCLDFKFLHLKKVNVTIYIYFLLFWKLGPICRFFFFFFSSILFSAQVWLSPRRKKHIFYTAWGGLTQSKVWSQPSALPPVQIISFSCFMLL